MATLGKIVLFLLVTLLGGPLLLFIVYAANGGAGGSSSLNAFSLVVLVICLCVYVPSVVGLARWAFRKSGQPSAKDASQGTGS